MAKIIEMSKTKPPASRGNLSELLRWLTGREREMVACVRELVERESPTHNKLACDKLCSYLAVQFERIGGRVKIHRQDIAGDHLQVDFSGAENRKPLLLLGISTLCMTRERLRPCPGARRMGGFTGRVFST